jgi:hypothetical protein
LKRKPDEAGFILAGTSSSIQIPLFLARKFREDYSDSVFLPCAAEIPDCLGTVVVVSSKTTLYRAAVGTLHYGPEMSNRASLPAGRLGDTVPIWLKDWVDFLFSLE